MGGVCKPSRRMSPNACRPCSALGVNALICGPWCCNLVEGEDASMLIPPELVPVLHLPDMEMYRRLQELAAMPHLSLALAAMTELVLIVDRFRNEALLTLSHLVDSRHGGSAHQTDDCGAWVVGEADPGTGHKTYDNSVLWRGGHATADFIYRCPASALVLLARSQLCSNSLSTESGCCVVAPPEVLPALFELSPYAAARLSSLKCQRFEDEFLRLWESGSVSGLHQEFTRSVKTVASAIDGRHKSMSEEEALDCRTRYAGSLRVFPRPITMWEVVEKLALTVDRSDAVLPASSQYVHSLQVFEGMLADGETDDWRLLLGVLHDVGKVLSLLGVPDEHVDGGNFVLSCPTAAGRLASDPPGLDSCIVTHNHDEFWYQKLLHCCSDIVSDQEEFLYGVRYHSLNDVEDTSILSEKDRKLMGWLFGRFTIYDHGLKNHMHMPQLDIMNRARALVDKWFPEPIVF